MRRLSLVVHLARHALNKASSSGPGCLSLLQDSPSSLAPQLLSLACPTVAHPSSSPRFATSNRGLPTPPRHTATGTAILREDGIALTDILENHPDLEEELDEVLRQQPGAQSTGTPVQAAAAQDRTPEAEAAQRAADALFDTELAARMMQVASQRRDVPTEASTSTTHNRLSSTNSTGASVRRGRVPPHPYAPPYDIYEARRGIEQTLKKMLARAGYYKRDLLNPRSLSLLKPTQLAEVCEDCGIPAPKGTTPAQLAQAVANLVALARQDSSHPPRNSTFTRRPSLAAVADDQATAGRGLRARVLQEARYRQHVLQLIAPPRKISSWLVAARAQDTVVVYPGNGENHTSVLIVATAVSQRHAAACVEAVRWQVSEALKSMSAAAAPGSREEGVLSAMSAPPAVGVGVGSDWVALDTGHAEVHVLTPAARAYYQLEASHGQSDSSLDHSQQSHGQARLLRISRPGAATPALTLDTIRAGTEPESESEAHHAAFHQEGWPGTAAASMRTDGFHPVSLRSSSSSSSQDIPQRHSREAGSKASNHERGDSHMWREARGRGQKDSQHQAIPGDVGAGSVWHSGERIAQTQAGGESGGQADCQEAGSRDDPVAGARRDTRRPLFEEL